MKYKANNFIFYNIEKKILKEECDCLVSSNFTKVNKRNILLQEIEKQEK